MKPLPSSEEILAYYESEDSDTQDSEASLVATVHHFIIEATKKKK